MSWSITLGPLAYPEIADAVLDAVIPEAQGQTTPETLAQLHVAKNMALETVRRMATDPKMKFFIYLSGHYGQSAGWTPAASIGVTVSLVSEQVPTPEEPKHE